MDIVLKEKVVKGFPYVRDNKFLEECHRRGWSSPEQYKSVFEGFMEMVVYAEMQKCLVMFEWMVLVIFVIM